MYRNLLFFWASNYHKVESRKFFTILCNLSIDLWGQPTSSCGNWTHHILYV